MNRLTWLGIVAVAVVALLAAGVALFVRASQGPRQIGYQPVVQPITQTLLVTGRLAQPARADLGATVQSTVVEVLVAEGATVEKGTLLVRLFDEDALARVAEAEATVREAEARLGRVRGVGRAVAGEQLRQARIQADDAERDYARNKRLFDDEALTEAAMDAARKQRDTARSQLVAAKLEATATGQTGSDTAAAAAALARSQAALEGAQVALDRTRIRAPSDGVVLQRLAEPGQVVRPGDALIRFSGGGDLEVRVTPDETHLGQLAEGQRAGVVVEAFADRTLDATVAFIAPLVDPERGTVEVRLALDDVPDDLTLRPDMTVTAEIVLGRRDEALVLPTELVRDLGSPASWVMLARDAVAVRQPVTLGLEGTNAVEIADGLTNDSVVLAVDARVEPGDPVRIKRVVSAETLAPRGDD